MFNFININSLSDAIIFILIGSTCGLWGRVIYRLINAVYLVLDDGMAFKRAWYITGLPK